MWTLLFVFRRAYKFKQRHALATMFAAAGTWLSARAAYKCIDERRKLKVYVFRKMCHEQTLTENSKIMIGIKPQQPDVRVQHPWALQLRACSAMYMKVMRNITSLWKREYIFGTRIAVMSSGIYTDLLWKMYTNSYKHVVRVLYVLSALQERLVDGSSESRLSTV